MHSQKHTAQCASCENVCPVADRPIFHFLPETVKDIKLQETFKITVNKQVANVCHVPSLHSQRICELMNERENNESYGNLKTNTFFGHKLLWTGTKC